MRYDSFFRSEDFQQYRTESSRMRGSAGQGLSQRTETLALDDGKPGCSDDEDVVNN